MNKFNLSKDKRKLLRFSQIRDKEVIIPDSVEIIVEDAFEYNSSFKSVICNSSLKTIKAKAFAETKVESIVFPASLESIEEKAFFGCTKLREVIFEGGDVTIAKNAFVGCKKTQLVFTCPAGSAVEEYAKAHKINIAGSKENSSETAFPFAYTISKNRTVKINAYIAKESHVIIPGVIEGCPVVAFNKDVFRNNAAITSVVWPAEIPVLPKEIFFGCSALNEVVLPEGVTEISEKAFRNCEALTSITIPTTVVTIHEKAFECAKYDSYVWEYYNCVKTICGTVGSYAETFSGALGIKFVPLNCSPEELEAISKYTYHRVTDGIALDDFSITDDMEKTSRGMPYLVRFEVPNEIMGQPVVELSAIFHRGQVQYSACGSQYKEIAETLVIPKSLKRIRCPLANRGIKNVIVSSDNKSVVFDEYAWYEDGGQTLMSLWLDLTEADQITKYTIRDGTVRVSEDIEQRFELDELYFPDSFVETHSKFLVNQTGFGPNSTVKKICANQNSCMRQHAEKIEAEFVALDRQSVVFSDDGTTLISYPPLFSERVYTVPETVRRIEAYAFQGNDRLEEIAIPDSVETIGEGAFAKCSALKKVVLPTSMAELPDMLFADCENLTTIKWPKTLRKIGKRCFANAPLESINIPGTVAEIDDYAFATTKMTKSTIASIVLPKSVRKLGISVCAGIENITVFDSIDPDAKPAEEFYDDANGIWNSNLGCIGIYQLDGYLHAACNAFIYTHAITVKSAEDGSVKYKVLMCGDEEPRDVYCAMVSSWGKNAEFNFSCIDEKFSNLKNAENRLATVLNRLAYPVDLSDEAKQKYYAWLKRNGTSIASKSIEKGDLAGLMSYEQYGIITKNNVQKLIDLAARKKKAKISAYLLEYKTKL